MEEEAAAEAHEIAVKRHREQQTEEKNALALMELTSPAEPLTLLVLVKSHFDTLVWAQLCNPQLAVFHSLGNARPSHSMFARKFACSDAAAACRH